MLPCRVKMSAASVNLILLLFVSIPVAQDAGNITYTLERVANPTQDQQSAYDAITKSMDSAIGYYNRWTTITKRLTVQYNTGVQTADAGFGGNIRFGSSRSYMVVHTAMHEIAHTVGVGTTTEYQNLIQNGKFTGTHATAMLREILGDPDTLLSGDSQHFWPFGLNYASEVGSEQDLINHCKMVNAMYKDMFGAEEFFRTCRIRSYAEERCMNAVNGSELALGGCDDEASLVDLVALDEQTYRLEFGDQVLDIPNESRDAGVTVALYGWNGGAHQRAVFEFEDGEDGPFRMRMKHSGLYLQADGNRVVQNNGGADDSFIWEMVDGKVAAEVMSNSVVVPQKKIRISAGRLVFTPDNSERTRLLVTDVRGRCVLQRSVDGKYDVPLSAFAKGIYVVSVRFGNAIVSRRIALQ